MLFALLSITVLIYSAVRLVKSNWLTIANGLLILNHVYWLEVVKKWNSLRRWICAEKKKSYWLTQPIIAHGLGSAGCWKTRAREENSRPRSRTTVFTVADYCAIQQTRQRIAQVKPSLRVNKNTKYEFQLITLSENFLMY